MMSELGRSAGDLEMLVDWGRQGSNDASFSAALDLAAGAVRVVGSGVWRETDATRYYADQRRVLEEARRRFGALRVSFDVRDWIVEGPQSATQFQGVNKRLYLPEDRLVAVVPSFAYKQHLRTALSVGDPKAFVSSNAAETWLQAYPTAAD